MITEKSPGYYEVDGFLFQTNSLGNKPFCHFCRKRVERAAVVVSSSEGCNPRHLCYDCCTKLVAGFGRLPNEKVS